MTALPAVTPPEPLPLEYRRPGTRDAGHPDRIPALDGVRGLAVLLVMAHHLFVLTPATVAESLVHDLAHTGFWGVDLFFVLSGFLITGILFDSKGATHYFRNFYARRTVRIFPLYYAFVFLMLVAVPWLAARFGQTAAAESTLGKLTPGAGGWYWSYLANFHMAYVEHYTHKTLAVAWSLAIEEQFYIVWPAVVLSLGRRALMGVSIAMLLIAIGSRLAVGLLAPDSNLKMYLLTPCRLDGLAVGAFIALALRRPGFSSDDNLARVAPLMKWAGVFGLYLVAAANLAYDLIAPTYWTPVLVFAGLALAFGGLVVACLAAPRTAKLSRVMSSAPMRTFGNYSYALYLFHFPVALILATYVFKPAHFGKFGTPLVGQAAFFVLATGVSLAAAWVSWNLFEKHFLKLKKYFPSGK
ncbi:MAG: acyltransferase family protein [Phycisphaerae bacterium]